MRREAGMADGRELLQARFGIDLPGVEVPDAIAGLYRGDNLGKRLIRL